MDEPNQNPVPEVKWKISHQQCDAIIDELKAARKNQREFIFHEASFDGITPGKTIRGVIPKYVKENVAITKRETQHQRGIHWIKSAVPHFMLDLEPDVDEESGQPSKFRRRVEAIFPQHFYSAPNGCWAEYAPDEKSEAAE